jgi:hypothetical protein
MTGPRRQRRHRHVETARLFRLAGLLVAVLMATVPVASHAATTERIVMNRFTGLAIEGFDPVAFFVDGQPRRGLPDLEAALSGAVWRFRNEGNRASFLAHPEVYGPQFGGYDPIDLARGVTLAGNPMFWVIFGQRLYLFAAEDHRDAFAADPRRVLPEVDRRWPALLRGLSE